MSGDDGTVDVAPTAAVGVEPAAVLQTLGRVLDSHRFHRAPRSRDFLAFVVTETVQGRSAQLSERTVARRAMGRDGAFDGRVDTSVRVRATRVRKSLEAYNDDEGRDDSVRITLPAGSYVPEFHRRRADGLVPSSSIDTAIGVLRFAAVGGPTAERLATAAAEGLVTSLSSFPGLTVAGPLVRLEDHPARAGSGNGIRFVLSGSVTAGDESVRLTARLTDVVTGNVVLSRVRDWERSRVLAAPVEDEWASAIAGEVGDYAGVVHRHSNEASAGSGSESDEYAAAMAFYAYVAAGDIESLGAARTALLVVVAGGASSPTVLTMTASCLAVGAGYGITQDPEGDLALAERYARVAMPSDRHAGHAHVVLGTVAMVRGQHDLVALHCRAAVTASPGLPTVLASAGTMLSSIGEWDEGIAVVREAIRLNPASPGYVHTMLAADLLFREDDAGALAEAAHIHTPSVEWGALFRALALAGLGYVDQGRAEWAEVLRIRPEFGEDPDTAFLDFFPMTERRRRVLAPRVAVLTGP